MQVLTPGGAGALTLGRELGKGGEGSVFAVESHGLTTIPGANELVAKLYHDPTAENRAKKLKAMISVPVADPAVAWPLAIVVDDQKRFLGYLMKKIDSQSNREWLYLANAKDRRNVAPEFNVRYAYAAVRNLAVATLAVHGAGHRIGDLNESNLLINGSATVSVVDTDSMQIRSASGEIFPCAVGKPEFTAPELTHGSLRDHPRTEETDLFAFAVAAYQLLTGGATPHQGSFDPTSDDDPLSSVERIRQGILPSLLPLQAKAYGFSPRPGVPVAALPSFLREHLVSFLSVEPAARSTPKNLETLLASLDRFIPLLEQCPREKNHWYPSGEPCGWCTAAAGGQDPWASSVSAAPAQARLRPINFQDGSSTPAAPPRAPATVAGPSAAPQQQTSAVSQNFQQNPSGAHPPGTPSGTQSSPAAVPPPRPPKIKGKVTVSYANGSWGVRPSIGVLLRSNPKLALWALKEETPGPIKFWWPVERSLATPLGLVLGLGLGLLLSLANYPLANLAFGQAASSFSFIHLSESLRLLLSWFPVLTAALASIWLFFSALHDRRKTRKKYGHLKNFVVENPWRTAVRFLPLGLFYGIPIVLVLIFLILYLLIIFIRAVAKA